MSGCGCDGHGLKPVDEALAELLARAPAPPAVESVALADALGRVLASDLARAARVDFGPAGRSGGLWRVVTETLTECASRQRQG